MIEPAFHSDLSASDPTTVRHSGCGLSGAVFARGLGGHRDCRSDEEVCGHSSSTRGRRAGLPGRGKASTPSSRWISAIFPLTARGAGVPSAFCLNCKFAGSAQELPSFARLDRWDTCPSWFVVIRGILLPWRRQAPHFCDQ
jgi:hypothetical protein